MGTEPLLSGIGGSTRWNAALSIPVGPALRPGRFKALPPLPWHLRLLLQSSPRANRPRARDSRAPEPALPFSGRRARSHPFTRSRIR